MLSLFLIFQFVCFIHSRCMVTPNYGFVDIGIKKIECGNSMETLSDIDKNKNVPIPRKTVCKVTCLSGYKPVETDTRICKFDGSLSFKCVLKTDINYEDYCELPDNSFLSKMNIKVLFENSNDLSPEAFVVPSFTFSYVCKENSYLSGDLTIQCDSKKLIGTMKCECYQGYNQTNSGCRIIIESDAIKEYKITFLSMKLLIAVALSLIF